MKYTKILTEEEFKKWCAQKGIEFSIKYYNKYLDKAWKKTEDEIDLKDLPF